MLRFLPDVARTRRAVGWVLLVVFGVPLGWLIWLTTQPGQWHGSAFFLFGGSALMLALGARLAFWPSEFIEIDPLSPGWGLRIEPAPTGYAMASTHRSWAPLQIGVGFLAMGIVVLGGSVSYGVWAEAWKGEPFAVVMAGLVSIIALSMAGMAGAGVRDTFFPGVVRIDDRGVSYRGRRMRFKQIEEVTATAPIELVGDGRILKLARTFCPLAATPAVVHELQRLIIEVALSQESGE